MLEVRIPHVGTSLYVSDPGKSERFAPVPTWEVSVYQELRRETLSAHIWSRTIGLYLTPIGERDGSIQSP